MDLRSKEEKTRGWKTKPGPDHERLKNFVKEFVFYPKNNREPLKSFKQRDSLAVLYFRNITKATD